MPRSLPLAARLLPFLLLAACGQTPSDTPQLATPPLEGGLIDGGWHRLQADLKSTGGFSNYTRTHSQDEVRVLLAKYGIGFQSLNSSSLTAQNIPCEKFLPQYMSNQVFFSDGVWNYIDHIGRPQEGWRHLAEMSPAFDGTYCATTVGNMVEDEEERKKFDGGHIIGRQMGGLAQRKNLAPQLSSLNRGAWVAIENLAATCNNFDLVYRVMLNYGSSTVVPFEWTLELQDHATDPPSIATFEFDNRVERMEVEVGRWGLESARAYAWLVEHNCVPPVSQPVPPPQPVPPIAFPPPDDGWIPGPGPVPEPPIGAE